MRHLIYILIFFLFLFLSGFLFSVARERFRVARERFRAQKLLYKIPKSSLIALFVYFFLMILGFLLWVFVLISPSILSSFFE